MLDWRMSKLPYFYKIGALLLYTECASLAEYFRIDSQVDQVAALPCPAYGSPPDDRAVAAFWYKDDQVIPFYAVDARLASSPAESQHRQLSALGQRAWFNVTVLPAFLHLKVDSRGDEGIYVCRVDFYRSLTKTSTVALRVTAPAPKLAIFEGIKALSGIAGPYKENSELELTCELTGGDQDELQLHWLIDATIVDVSFTRLAKKLQNVLFLKRILRQHLMSTITCLATKDNSTSSQLLKTSVQLDVFLLPLEVYISPKHPTTSESSAIELSCMSRGSRPPAEVSWWMNGFRLYNVTTEIRNPNVTTSNISLNPSAGDLGKSLSCRAENPEIQDNFITDSATLNVTFPPRVSLSLKTYSSGYISEGGTVALICHVKANPQTKKVTWTFVKGPYYSFQDGRHEGTLATKAGSFSLILEKLEAKHKGSYRCNATNSEGTKESNSLWLAVQHRPVCIPGQQVSYGATRGETLHIRCEVDAEPPLVTFYWSFANTIVRHANVSYSSRSLRSIATYTPIEDVHLGSLFCWANNSVGEQQVPCTFTVYLPAKPNPPRNCAIRNATQTSLTIVCQPGYDGGATQKFWLRTQVQSVSGVDINASSNTPAFTLTGLLPATTFYIVVDSVNKMGRSTAVTLEGTTRSNNLLKGIQSWKTKQMILLTSLFLILIIITFISISIILKRNSHSPLLS